MVIVGNTAQMEKHSPKLNATSLIAFGLLVIELESVPREQAVVLCPTSGIVAPSEHVTKEGSTLVLSPVGADGQ
jgi:hypothetical protein